MAGRRCRRSGLLAGLCLGVVACPPPADVTPLIHVDPRAAQRLDWLARPAAHAPASARVHVMKEGEQLGGPNAIGRPGDLLLENDEVVFVVDQLGSSAGFAESGGNLVDAADARQRKDELGQVFTYFGVFPRQGVYDSLSSGRDGDAAWVEARGHELYEANVGVTTRYTLRAPDRALLLETTLENRGAAPVELPALGDAIQWGAAEKFAPGLSAGFTGKSSGPYVGGVGRFASYAMTSTEGEVVGVSGRSWTDTSIKRGVVALPPGGKTSYARVFVIGDRADSSSLVAELAMAAGQPVGELAVALGGGVELPPGIAVSLALEGAAQPLTFAAPLAGVVPSGRYRLRVGAGPEVGPVEVRAGERAEVAVEAPRFAAVHARCVEGAGPVPCKVTFEGTGATPTPDFGGAAAAGPARSQVTTADGAADVAVLPGRYRLTASRGPEYALASADLDLAAGQSWSGTLRLARVVDTSGYLACDFHQHTMLGADAPTSPADRVVSNLAEGVEIAVASEHNLVADLGPYVRRARAERWLVSIPGDELTTDASRHAWGHANVWPMPVEPAAPRGGAPPVRDRTPLEVLGQLRRELPGEFVFQVNHPRTGLTGYFDQLGFDPARGRGADPGYDPAFDALEVWNGRNDEARARVLGDWRALLRAGHRVTPTADTDTHGVVGQEAGYPRTYVRVSDDGPLDGWDAGRAADLVAGVKARRDVVLTNGPMLRVTANGAPVGGVARGRAVTVKVHVECAPWVTVDEVHVERATGGPVPPPVVVKLAPTAAGALAADAALHLTISADDALYVVASGSKPMSPVLAGDAATIAPWAMTGAVWIDADGDGKTLGEVR